MVDVIFESIQDNTKEFKYDTQNLHSKITDYIERLDNF